MTTLANVLTKALAREGIKHIFGYPGGSTVELMESARRDGIEFVLARSEIAAGYMANTYGELTGKPGVCAVTQGPGASALVNPTVNALLDRAPMLVVTASNASTTVSTHQAFDQRAVFGPITKHSVGASVDTFERQVLHALRVASTEFPGPVHIDVPEDLFDRETRFDDLALAASPVRYHGLPQGLMELATRLSDAERPVVLVGNSATRQGVYDALPRFADRWGIPVVTTAKAKGVVPESHPYWAGVIEMPGTRFMNRWLLEADFFLAVGFDTVELIGDWKPTAPIARLDVRPYEDPECLIEREYLGDTAKSLNFLSERAPSAPIWCADTVATYRRDLEEHYTLVSDAGISPSELVHAARSVVSDDAIVVTDVGSHKITMGGMWRTERPRTFFQSHGFGSMASGLPGAIAAQIVHPDRQVLCFTGDGGLAMVLGEVATAAERSLPVVIVVFNDSSLDRIRRKQDVLGYAPEGTRIQNPDFLKLADAFGIAAYTASTAEEVARAIKNALAERRPALVEVVVDTREYDLQFTT